MNLNINFQNKQIQNFEQYAKFISKNFDVQVVLDSTKAQTDGKVIYLPSVSNMTSLELEMMYAILLHEIGHIKYSTFDEAYFSQFKTESHAFMANALEDARIENLLIKDYAGGVKIFEDLYNKYLTDKKLMYKFFNVKNQKVDFFTGLSFYMHHYYATYQTQNIQNVCSKYIYRRIMAFIKRNKLNDYFNNHPLKSEKEVITVSKYVYELIAKDTNIIDKSGKVSYKDLSDKKNQIKSDVDSLKNEFKKDVEKYIKLEKDIEKKYDELNKYQKSIKKEVDDINSKIENINKKQSLLDKAKDMFENNEDLKKQINTLNTSNEHQKKLKEQYEKEVDALKEKLKNKNYSRYSNRKDKDGNEISPEDALSKKLEQKKKILENSIQKIKKQEDSIFNIKKEIDKIEKNKEYDKNFTSDEYDRKSLLNKDELSNYENKLSDFNDVISDYTQEIQEIQMSKENIENEMRSKLMDVIYSIDKNVEFDLDLIPKLHYLDTWPEAAEQQEVFDENASKLLNSNVRNGQENVSLYGTDVRDILITLENINDKINEIDISNIFKDKINISMFDNYEIESTIKVYSDDKSFEGIVGTYKEHIPFTTELDVVKKELTSNKKQEIYSLIAKNKDFYKNLENIILKKFKYSKKDLWKGNREEGSLDQRNLWKLPTNQGDDYYEVNQRKIDNKNAAVILIDISGSQNKEDTDYGKKIIDVVLGLSLALDKAHIKHEIIGYHAPISQDMRDMNPSHIYTRRSNYLETIIYKEANQKDNSGILNIDLKVSDNSDGESLKYALKRLKMMNAKSKMLFMIADGKPYLTDGNISVLDEDLKDGLRKAVNNKVQVYGLGFFKELQNFFGNRYCDINNYQNLVTYIEKEC